MSRRSLILTRTEYRVLQVLPLGRGLNGLQLADTYEAIHQRDLAGKFSHLRRLIEMGLVRVTDYQYDEWGAIRYFAKTQTGRDLIEELPPPRHWGWWRLFRFIGRYV